jgi:hypothetical protein
MNLRNNGDEDVGQTRLLPQAMTSWHNGAVGHLRKRAGATNEAVAARLRPLLCAGSLSIERFVLRTKMCLRAGKTMHACMHLT